MPKMLDPANFGLPSLPLVPVQSRHRCKRCGEIVTEKRWSPYWCPDCDIERMARISQVFNGFEKHMGGVNV